MSEFDSRQAHVVPVVGKVSMGQVLFKHLGYPLPLPYYQFSTHVQVSYLSPEINNLTS
jgi:hypothetical protein